MYGLRELFSSLMDLALKMFFLIFILLCYFLWLRHLVTGYFNENKNIPGITPFGFFGGLILTFLSLKILFYQI